MAVAQSVKDTRPAGSQGTSFGVGVLWLIEKISVMDNFPLQVKQTGLKIAIPSLWSELVIIAVHGVQKGAWFPD